MLIEKGIAFESADQLKENKIIGELNDETSTISFKGKNNILYLDGNVRLNNCEISFLSSNAVIYLSGSDKHDFKLKLECWRSSFAYIGSGNYFNNTLSMIASERKGIVIGGDGVFSFGIWIRTADPHILYDADTHERINSSKNVLVGDHVWLGQNSIILKGTTIGSGSVIGAASVVSGKRIESNTVYAGNPARKIKENIFFSGDSVHNYTKKKTKESMHYAGDEYIFNKRSAAGSASFTEPLDEELLFQMIQDPKTSEERLKKIKELLADNTSHSRFAILVASKHVKKGFFRR